MDGGREGGKEGGRTSDENSLRRSSPLTLSPVEDLPKEMWNISMSSTDCWHSPPTYRDPSMGLCNLIPEVFLNGNCAARVGSRGDAGASQVQCHGSPRSMSGREECEGGNTGRGRAVGSGGRADLERKGRPIATATALPAGNEYEPLSREEYVPLGVVERAVDSWVRAVGNIPAAGEGSVSDDPGRPRKRWERSKFRGRRQDPILEVNGAGSHLPLLYMPILAKGLL
jgi:hypothetical protein